MQSKPSIKAYFLILLAGIFWGFTGIFTNLFTAMGLDPMISAFIRVGVSVPILFVILLFTGKGPRLFRMTGRGYITSALLGVCSVAFLCTCYMKSIAMNGMSAAVIMLYTSPVFVCVMSALFFKEKMTGSKITAIAVNLLGCVLTVMSGGGVRLTALGILFGIGSGFAYSLLPVIGKLGSDKDDPLSTNFYSFLVGAVVIGLAARPFPAIAAHMSPRLIVLMILCALVTAVIPYVCYFRGLKQISETSRVPVIASVENVAASVVGFAVFHEAVTPVKIVGIVLVMLSIVIMNSGAGLRRKRAF